MAITRAADDRINISVLRGEARDRMWRFLKAKRPELAHLLEEQVPAFTEHFGRPTVFLHRRDVVGWERFDD